MQICKYCCNVRFKASIYLKLIILYIIFAIPSIKHLFKSYYISLVLIFKLPLIYLKQHDTGSMILCHYFTYCQVELVNVDAFKTLKVMCLHLYNMWCIEST